MTEESGNRVENPVPPPIIGVRGSEPREVRYGDLARPSQFLDVVAPIRDGWLAILDAAEEVRESYHRRPADGSIAAGEAASQAEIAGVWGDAPVDDARSMVWTLVAAAEGSLAAYAEVLVSDRVGPYALDVQARPVIENLARALWLAEPALGRDLRVKRAQTDRIYSLVEQGQLDPEFRAHSKQREDRIIATAHALGWDVLPASRKKRAPRRLVERRSATQLAGDLFLDDDKYGLGRTMYRLLSATAHGTLYALVYRLRHVTDHPSGSENLAAVAISTDEIRLLSHTLLLGYVSFFDRWYTYLGWSEIDDLNAAIDALRKRLGPVQARPPRRP